ncbi:biogenesis of lysosome-related organelles complex 1 subunit 6-like [Ylistrum balloti]|uniref:biogenesis of lysosome-related organelles complex 1 subunit 6-like n=1 Tax=Ylistrum balloti TaxID=509963 RepID=UPI0029058AE5|nr:biogenesis of lysosome-related organelles complex 1 subunit 6-like [Ylistrum balloti]
MSGEASAAEDEKTPGDVAEIAVETKDDKSNVPIEDKEKDEEVDDSVPIDPAIIEKLTLGTLEHYLPNLQKSKSSLNEILQNQGILIETIQQENTKFAECKAMEDLVETMTQAKKYYARLNNLRKEMQSLSDRSFKLKKRALKLQQQKQKEELLKEEQREKEQDRERMLTAKVANKDSTLSPPIMM